MMREICGKGGGGGGGGVSCLRGVLKNFFSLYKILCVNPDKNFS